MLSLWQEKKYLDIFRCSETYYEFLFLGNKLVTYAATLPEYNYNYKNAV